MSEMCDVVIHPTPAEINQMFNNVEFEVDTIIHELVDDPEFAPVKTGKMRDSIYAVVRPESLRIIYATPYSKNTMKGSRGRKARQWVKQEYTKVIQEEVNWIQRGAGI